LACVLIDFTVNIHYVKKILIYRTVEFVITEYLKPFYHIIGHGTTHKVNNLLIQMDGHFTETPLTTIRKQKRRSFKLGNENAQVHGLVGGKRIGPEELKFPENPEKEFLFAGREKVNFIWALMRTTLPKKIPSWTGINITIEDQVPVMKSSVLYLDCIDNPATEKTTIYQVSNTWILIKCVL